MDRILYMIMDASLNKHSLLHVHVQSQLRGPVVRYICYIWHFVRCLLKFNFRLCSCTLSLYLTLRTVREALEIRKLNTMQSLQCNAMSLIRCCRSCRGHSSTDTSWCKPQSDNRRGHDTASFSRGTRPHGGSSDADR